MLQSLKFLATAVGFLTGLGYFLAFWMLGGYSLAARLFMAVIVGILAGWLWLGWNSAEGEKKVETKQKRLSYSFRRSKRLTIVEAQKLSMERRNKRSIKNQRGGTPSRGATRLDNR